MPAYTGTALEVTFNGTVISGDYTEFSWSREVGLVENSAGSDQERTYNKTLKDGTATMTGYRQDTDVTRLVEEGDEGDLVWLPKGNASGNPRYTVNAIVTSYEESIPFDGNVEYTISFQFSGALTEDTTI